ncbi:MAG: CDP-alcohol phosphatidyltransferase family protein [Lawsonella clevelandensis]
MMTIFGTVLNVTLAIVLIAITEHVTIGAILSGLTVFVDLIDGAMARQIGHGTPYGAVLDATLDRIADGAVIGSILWWEIDNRPDDTWLLITTIVTLVFSEVISYAKARAEASGNPGQQRIDRAARAAHHRTRRHRIYRYWPLLRCAVDDLLHQCRYVDPGHR